METAEATLVCPERTVLEQFLRDRLSDEESRRVDSHVESCDMCRHTLTRLMDSLSETLRQVAMELPAAALKANRFGSAASEPRPELDGYEVLNRLGSGGMGVVWRVRDLEFGRDLALKVMKKWLSGAPELERRFLNEAHVCGRLTHPGIVPVHALGRLDDGRPYYLMKLVAGQTLSAMLARRGASTDGLIEMLKVFSQVCEAVAFAHHQNVIHRDLKPANVMVGEHGEVQLLDWGLAKELRIPGCEMRLDDSGHDPPSDGQAADSDLMTEPGNILGTLAYIAPEQARGLVDEVDCRSDVFGLGTILCEILTGEPPYIGSDEAPLREQAMSGDLTGAVKRLRSCSADVELIELAEHCLAADPADRPADAGFVAREIAAYLDAVAEQARQAEWARAKSPRTALRRAWQRCRQRPLMSASVGMVAMAVVLSLAIVATRPSNKLRVGIKPWIGFSPLAVADDLKLCQGIDLVLTPVEDHEDALQKLSKGEIDVVLCPVEGHVHARAAGYRTKTVLKLDDSLSADAVLAREEIRSPADLIGRSVVFVQMDAPHFLILALADRKELKGQTINLVAAATAKEAINRFIQDETIAAIAIYEPFLQQVLDGVKGAHVLTTAEQESGAIVDLLTVDEELLSRRPGMVQSLTKGWFQGVELLNASDPQAVQSACKFLGGKHGPVSASQYQAMAAGMRYSDQAENAKFFRIDAKGSSEFRARISAAHDRLSQGGYLRDTSKGRLNDGDGSSVLFAENK